jgi:hypothetical protein
MSEVYANSYLTIAAVSSLRGEFGFLGPRVAHLSKTLRFKSSHDDSHVQVRRKISHVDSEASAANPLYSRAWAFQEMVVSPRVVSYSSEELQWHCRQVSLCECDQWHNFSTSLDLSIVKSRRDTLASEYKTAPIQQEENLSRWYRVLCGYTHLKLTVPSDRLPAL